jgi:RHS repeat-associated protein
MMRYAFFFLISIASVLSASAQIQGPSPAYAGTTVTYTYNDGSYYPSYYWVVSSRGTIVSSSDAGTTYSVTVQWNTTGSATLYLREPNEFGPPAYFNRASKSITVTTCPTVTAPTVSGNYRFGTGTFTLTGSGAPAGGTYQWFNSGGTLVATAASYTTASVSATTSNYMTVKVKTAEGCVSAATPVTVTVASQPVITASSDRIVMDVPVTLNAGAGYDSYAWKNHITNTVVGTAQTYAATTPGTYTVTVTKNGASATTPAQLVKGPWTDQNLAFRVTHTLRTAVTDAAQVSALSASQDNRTIVYSDGWGRPIQSVVVQASPLMKDVVQPLVYDDLGRSAKTYLPYVSTENNGRLKADPVGVTAGYTNSAQYQFYQATGDRIANDTQPFAVSVYENSPVGIVTQQGAPGSDWQPGQHTVSSTFRTNTTTDAIRIWKADLTSPGLYAAGSLSVNETTDENGNKVISFTDKAGRPLQKHVQADATTWLKTLYIYDEIGRLKYTLQPEGVRQLGSSTTIAQSLIDQHGFAYTYDNRQRVVEKKIPGSAPVYFGYDPLDRLTLVQDGNLRAQNKWLFIKYDRLHRPVMQGIYTNATQTTRASVQALLDALVYTTGETYYEKEQSGTTHGYSNQSFPTTNTQLLVVNYYDDYDITGDLTADASYVVRSLAKAGTPSTARGLLTATKKVVVGTGTWLTAFMFYDEFGRPIQVQHNHHLSAAIDNLTTNTYNFDGSVHITETVHKKGVAETIVKQRYDYDHMGRVLKVWHTVNAQTELLSVAYEYNELGQVVDKKLHSTNAGTTYLQSVDYRYNIRGWLTSMNNAELSATGDKNNDPDSDRGDYFGLELSYNTQDAGLTNTVAYNGNITALRWNGTGAPDHGSTQRSYQYTYDKSDRMTAATFKAGTASNWTQENNTLNESLTYDDNGNMKTLQRMHPKHDWSSTVPTYVSQTVDALTYTYAANGNQLARVDDTALSKGFVNGVSQTTEYTYDANGNLTADLNKGISSVVYNELGKVSQVNFTDGRVMNYTYDGTGQKLSQSITQNSTTVTTDYAGGFVYEGGQMKFFGSPEGRVIVNAGSFEYQYSLSDHQGNTRVVFSAATPAAQTATATFEATSNSNFQNYPSGAGRSSLSTMNHTASGTYSQLLNGGYNAQVGIAKSYKVYPGDKVKIQAYAKYVSNGATGNLGGFATALLGAFGYSAPAPGETGTASAGLQSWGSVVAAGSGPGSSSAPKAFVTILQFDKDFNFLDFAIDQIDAGANTTHDLLEREVTIAREGYVFMYISNENATQVDVYFDDVTMTYTPSNIVQYNEYYPFGLQASTSWTRGNTVNNFLYNGASELNTNAQWYEMFFRGYDPAIGRMLQVDPMVEKYAGLTPYNYAFNDPVYYSDPSGADPITIRGNVITVNWDETGAFGGKWRNGNWEPFTSEQEVAGWALDNFDFLGAIEPHAYARLMGIERKASWVHFKYDINFRRVNGSNVGIRWIRPNEQQTQNGPDRSTLFHFVPETMEFWAYKQMLMDQSVDGKEINAFLVTKKGTNERGVLILPWAGNSKDGSWPYHGVDFTNKTIIDDNGVEYIPSLWIHTHPENQFSPSGLGGDMSVMSILNSLWPGLTGGILTNSFYTPYDTSLQPRQFRPSSNDGLLDGSNSLFK